MAELSRAPIDSSHSSELQQVFAERLVAVEQQVRARLLGPAAPPLFQGPSVQHSVPTDPLH